VVVGHAVGTEELDLEAGSLSQTFDIVFGGRGRAEVDIDGWAGLEALRLGNIFC